MDYGDVGGGIYVTTDHGDRYKESIPRSKVGSGEV